MSESTSSLYNRSQENWVRQEPVLLSDYTARPLVLQACEPLGGARVLDLGCGEGYVSRQIAKRGAASILAYDISEGMIEQARQAERREPCGIDYHVGDVSQELHLPPQSFDLAIAVFLFNYLDLAQMQRVFETVHQALKPGGRFIYTVPHPLLPFLRPQERPFYFDRGTIGYFSGRDSLFEGRIWRRDGIDVPVRCLHKTFTDYFNAMRAAGFEHMPRVSELHVTEAHIQLDPDFFEPLRDQPLHVLFEI